MEFNKADVPAIGRAIYQERIRPKLGPECKGKVVVIDIKSGDYEIADRHREADLKLRERCPDAYTWEEWVDVPVTYKMHPMIKPVRRD